MPPIPLPLSLTPLPNAVHAAREVELAVLDERVEEALQLCLGAVVAAVVVVRREEHLEHVVNALEAEEQCTREPSCE